MINGDTHHTMSKLILVDEWREGGEILSIGYWDTPHIFGLWEESRVTGGNQQAYRENKTPHRKALAGFQARTYSPRVATHCISPCGWDNGYQFLT